MRILMMDNGKVSPTPEMDHRTLGLIEVLGPAEAEVFSSITGPTNERNELEIRGILIRAGRAGFYYWMKKNWESLGWNDQGFRFQPVKKKITSGLMTICSWFEKEWGNPIRFQNEENSWVIEIPGRAEPTSVKELFICSYLRGVIQEFAQWAGIGKFYIIREESCALNGKETCVIRIMKEPTD